MTQENLTKIWSTIGLALLYYSLNTWIVTQGGNPIFGVAIISQSRVPAAFIGIPICCVLLIFFCWAGVVYARRAEGSWAARIPLIGFEKIDRSAWESKVYLFASFVVLAVLPFAAILHFWDKVWVAPIVKDGQKIGFWQWDKFFDNTNDTARICTDYTPGPPAICDNNATFLPGFEPAFWVLLTLGAAGLLILNAYTIFATRKATRAVSGRNKA